MEGWLPALFSMAGALGVALIEARAAKGRKEEKQSREHSKAVDDGVQALLRDRIIERYNHYMDQKHIPIYGMENVLDMYSAYHKLGGNGTITKLVDTLLELPTEL